MATTLPYITPLQALPSWLSYSIFETTISPDSPQPTVITTQSVVNLPLTYYGPPIPLGTDGVWVYGGLTSPTATPTSSSSSSSLTSTTTTITTSASSSSSSPTSTTSTTTSQSTSASSSSSTTTFTNSPTTSTSSTGTSAVGHHTPVPVWVVIVLGTVIGVAVLVGLLLACGYWYRRRNERATAPQVTATSSSFGHLFAPISSHRPIPADEEAAGHADIPPAPRPAGRYHDEADDEDEDEDWEVVREPVLPPGIASLSAARVAIACARVRLPSSPPDSPRSSRTSITFGICPPPLSPLLARSVAPPPRIPQRTGLFSLPAPAADIFTPLPSRKLRSPPDSPGSPRSEADEGAALLTAERVPARTRLGSLVRLSSLSWLWRSPASRPVSGLGLLGIPAPSRRASGLAPPDMRQRPHSHLSQASRASGATEWHSARSRATASASTPGTGRSRGDWTSSRSPGTGTDRSRSVRLPLTPSRGMYAALAPPAYDEAGLRYDDALRYEDDAPAPRASLLADDVLRLHASDDDAAPVPEALLDEAPPARWLDPRRALGRAGSSGASSARSWSSSARSFPLPPGYVRAPGMRSATFGGWSGASSTRATSAAETSGSVRLVVPALKEAMPPVPPLPAGVLIDDA